MERSLSFLEDVKKLDGERAHCVSHLPISSDKHSLFEEHEEIAEKCNKKLNFSTDDFDSEKRSMVSRIDDLHVFETVCSLSGNFRNDRLSRSRPPVGV